MAAHQHLRRRADYSLVSQPQEEHVRRRIDRPQRTIDGDRLTGELRREPLRKDRLITVAGGDVFFDPSYTSFEIPARPVGFKRHNSGAFGNGPGCRSRWWDAS